MISKQLFLLLVALVITAGCATNEIKLTESATGAIAVCASAYSEEVQSKLIASAGKGSADLEYIESRRIGRSVLLLPGFSPEQSIQVYDMYLECIDNRSAEAGSQFSRDGLEVATVNQDIHYEKAGFFSDYHWNAVYRFTFQNSGIKDATCELTAWGGLKNRETGSHNSIHSEREYQRFFLTPGDYRTVEGEVGIYGFSNRENVVAARFRYNCWPT